MAYNQEEIYSLAISSIEKENLYFIEDVISFLPISKPTFYDYFKVDSNELNYIKELLDGNKIRMKIKLRRKLSEGDKAAEILALYKLIATDDERKALSMQHIDHSGEVTTNIISLGNGTAPETK